MCLYITTSQPKIAKKDIRVIKILKSVMTYHNIGKEYRYITPFMSTLVPDTGKMHTFENVDIYLNLYPYSNSYYYEIGRGVIHSYKYSRKNLKEVCLSHRVCFEAIIPKGTEYYNGVDVNGYEALASKTLHINLDKPIKISQ